MDTKQDWKGLDGVIAWHFIERQAENWNQVGEMMNEWLKANTPTKEWVGLTNDDKYLIKYDADYNQFMTASEYADRVQALTEARLKDKNAL